VGHYLRGRPRSAPTQEHLRERAGLPAHYCTTVDDRRGPPVSSLFPQIFPPLLAHVTTIAKLLATGWPPITTPRTRMVACSPITLSHHVRCGAPWCPITAGRCSAAAHHCSSQNEHAMSSPTKPHTACLTGHADVAESTPSRPWHSPVDVRA
jgi:hypothetical protein